MNNKLKAVVLLIASTIIFLSISMFFLPLVSYDTAFESWFITTEAILWMLVPTSLSIVGLYMFRLVTVRNLFLAVGYSMLILAAPTLEHDRASITWYGGEMPSSLPYVWHWFTGWRGPFVSTAISGPLLLVFVGVVILFIAKHQSRKKT